MGLLKEKILIIAPTVPRPDRNSGDLRLYSILEILVKEYEITFVATSHGPDYEPYIALLKQLNINVNVELSSLKTLLNKEKFKFAILEFYHVAQYYLDRIRILQPECFIVVDSVDVHYLRAKRKFDLTKSEADHQIYRETKENELAVYSRADAVITVTMEDASALFEESPDIACQVVSNIHKICLNDVPPERDTLVFVGGFSHDPNVDAVLYFCNEILPLISKDKPWVKFSIVGDNPPHEIRMLERQNITVTGYVPDTTTYLHRSHVSVAPLRYGAGMKGKIGEAMAYGVPVVTTSIGAQGMGLTNRENVMIADSPPEFAAAVLELTNDSFLYGAIRENAIKVIDNNYTPRQVGQAMLSALEKIRNRPVKRMTLQKKVAFFNAYLTHKIKNKSYAGLNP